MGQQLKTNRLINSNIFLKIGNKIPPPSTVLKESNFDDRAAAVAATTMDVMMTILQGQNNVSASL